MTSSGSLTDTIDIADIARSLKQGWRWIAAAVVAGCIIAALVIVFGPRRFDGSASAIIRSAGEGGGLLSRIGEGSGAAALLGGSASSPIETDLQILSSRSVLGAVIDTLLLQAEVRAPAVPATALLRSAHFKDAFKHVDLHVERTSSGDFAYSSGTVAGTVKKGGQIVLPVGTLVLRDSLPAQFDLRIFDREDALRRVGKSVGVAKAGGEVVRVGYRARDSLTAAAVPNAVLLNYLLRRRTDDRGVNTHKVEFLVLQIDSTAVLQNRAEDALRRFQEQSGIVDAQVVGKLELEGAAELRKSLGALDVEQGALDQMLKQVASGRMTARQIAAYPSFLKSPAINDMLRQIGELETERTKLLERRLETDDEVVALTRSITNLEGQLVPLATSYLTSLQRQRADVSAQVGGIASTLRSFPAGAQSNARLVREVMRLSQLSLALQAQLVQARLAAIMEGGDVRALDLATPPKEVAVPEPWLTTGLGLGLGLLFGLGAALVAGSHGRYLDGPAAIERMLGVPAVRFIPGTPLLMSGREAARTLLLIPIDAGTSTEHVAARLADTAVSRGDIVRVLDFSDPAMVMRAGATASVVMERAEENSSTFVIARLPGLASESTAALLSRSRPVLLVTPGERVHRQSLTAALDTLRRLDVPVAGVVLAESTARAALTA